MIEIRNPSKLSALWYKTLDRLLGWVIERRAFKKLPHLLRKFVYQLSNWPLAFHEFNRLMADDSNDPVHNLLLPEGEHISLPIIWVCEMYPPSYAAELARNLKKRGWNGGFAALAPGDEVTAYLDKIRGESHLGWHSLETIRSRESQFFGHAGAKRENLAKEFDHINLVLVPLGSALTAIVASFNLSDAGLSVLETAIVKPHEPRVDRKKGRIQLVDRRTAGIEVVQNSRNDLHSLARKWMKENLPGVFAMEGAGNLPIADLIIRYGSKDSEEYRRKNRNYLESLGLMEITEGSSEALLGVYLAEYQPIGSLVEGGNAWSVYGEFDSMLQDEELKYSGGRTLNSISFQVDDEIRFLITRLSITSLLRLKTRLSAKSRDVARTTYGRRPVHSSKLLRKSLLRNSLDLFTIATEIKNLTRDAHTYSHGIVEYRMRFSRWIREQDSRSGFVAQPYDQALLDQLRSAQRLMSNSLISNDAEVRSILATVASLNSSIGGIRSQRWSLGVSFVASVIALIALFVTRTRT